MRLSRELPDVPLVEPTAGGREQEHPAAIGIEGLDRSEERFGLHDHPGTPAVGLVVDGAVAIVGPIPQVVHPNDEEPAVDRATQEALGEGRLQDPGEDRDDVDQHGARLTTLRSEAPRSRMPQPVTRTGAEAR
jgi:hypothetical protein